MKAVGYAGDEVISDARVVVGEEPLNRLPSNPHFIGKTADGDSSEGDLFAEPISEMLFHVRNITVYHSLLQVKVSE